MKVVVTGGCGHIGTYLIPMLVNAGYDVINITRGKSQPYEYDSAWEKVRSVFMDRSKELNFAGRIAALNPDVVVDLINFDIRDTKTMTESLRNSKCSHYLYCSSCWAHGHAEVLPFNPDDLKKEPLDSYGEDKFASELYLKDLYRKDWCEYVGDPKECEDTYYHITRSGFYDISKEEKLLDYHPKYTNVETIKIAVQSYFERQLITVP